MLEKSPVQFEKPPVVEAWIEFKFALTDEASIWDEEAARTLMRTHYEGFNVVTFLKSTQIEVKFKGGKPDFTDSKEFFDRIKAFSQDGDQCIQAGRDVFVFNQLKKDSWHGYEQMRDTAVEVVGSYALFRDFHSLTSIALHYLDIVSIPRDGDSGINLSDWFRIYPEVPEDTFGTMSGFSFSIQLPGLCGGAQALLTIQSMPPESDQDKEVKFSLDWHIVSADNKIRELDAVKDWLDSAHKALRSSFEKAFTVECLQLFEPIKEE